MRWSYHTREINIPETIFSGVLTRIDRVNVELVLWDSKGVDVVAAVNYMVSDFSIYQTHFYKFLSPRNCAKLKKTWPCIIH